MVHVIKAVAAMDNANGGWNIGGEKYQVQIVEYDDNNDQTSANSAVNRLIFEDKVNYILFDSGLADASLPTTEANKVIALLATPTPPCLMPANHYSFETAFVNSQYAALAGFMAKAFPNFKTLVTALPDNQMGHGSGDPIVAACKAVGITATAMYFPANSTDLSSLGTKVKTLNPDMFDAQFVGGLPYQAAYNAGYRGQMVGLNPQPYSICLATASAEAMNGLVNAGWPTEFDPPLTDLGKQVKEAYVSMYGKWDTPEIICTAEYFCLKAALAKAGTPDTTKVAEVIGSGLQFEALNGSGQMVARPDLGNNRTVDSVVAYYIKKVENDQITKFGSMTLDEVSGYFSKAITPQ